MRGFDKAKVTHYMALFVSICSVVPVFFAAGLPSPLSGNLFGVALYVFAVWGMTDALLILLGLLQHQLRRDAHAESA